MKLGEAIRLCRTRRKLSLNELAELSDCSASYLSMLENAKRDPSISTVTKIAAALHVPIEILFFLGADKGELVGIDKNLAGQLAVTALDILNEPLDAIA